MYATYSFCCEEGTPNVTGTAPRTLPVFLFTNGLQQKVSPPPPQPQFVVFSFSAFQCQCALSTTDEVQKTCTHPTKRKSFPSNQKMSKNQDNKAHTLKAPHEKVYLLPPQQLNDILSHHADEEQCAQNMIVLFFFVCALGAFIVPTLLHEAA